MEVPKQWAVGSTEDIGGTGGTGLTGRPAGWAPVGLSFGPAADPDRPGPGPDLIRSILALGAVNGPAHDDANGRGHGPEVVPSNGAGAGESSPSHPSTSGVSSATATVTTAVPTGGLDVAFGTVEMAPVEDALPDVVRLAESDGRPFRLFLARPGPAVVPGAAVPAVSPDDVADLAAALSAALGPEQALFSAGPAHLAVVIPGGRERRASALARSAAAGGAPTFTWAACRYPRDARTARSLFQLAAHRLDGAERFLAEDATDDVAVGADRRAARVLAALAFAVTLVAAVLVAGGGKSGTTNPRSLREIPGTVSAQGGSGSTGAGSGGAGQGAASTGRATAGTGNAGAASPDGGFGGVGTAGAGATGHNADGSSSSGPVGAGNPAEAQGGVSAGGAGADSSGSSSSEAGSGASGTGSTGTGTSGTGSGPSDRCGSTGGAGLLGALLGSGGNCKH